jgi:subtilisin family serine protease
MKTTQQIRYSVLLLAASLAGTALAPTIPSALAQSEQVKMRSNQYIVTRKMDRRVAALSSEQIRYTNSSTSEFFDVVLPERSGRVAAMSTNAIEQVDWDKVAADCGEILKDPTIATCEPNVIRTMAALPNDPLLSRQWSLNDTSGADADIDAPESWDSGTGTSSTLIGLIDTGVDFTHPDLRDNLWVNPGEPADGIDNDSNGIIDDFFGGNFSTMSNNPMDCYGHGTHVSGIMAARGNNGIGISGVNWTTSLIGARVSDCKGEFDVAAVLRAYDYFYNLKRKGHKIRVVNASYGGPSYSPAEFAALSRWKDADIILVASAMNEDTNNDKKPSYPANYQLPNVISVGATGPNLQMAGYSNYGQSVDIAAPGGDQSKYVEGGILSTIPLSEAGNNPPYGYKQGTSMAAPVVTGALALLASQQPDLSGQELVQIMLNTAYNFPHLEGLVNNRRFINLKGMLAAGNEFPDQCPADPQKRQPGVCGCGVPESLADSDRDGRYDCVDGCPSDFGKVEAGVCGCGIPDIDNNGDGVVDCQESEDGNVDEVEFPVPTTPSLRASRRAVSFSITPAAGYDHWLKVTTKTNSRRSRASTQWHRIDFTAGYFDRLPSGMRFTLQYGYTLPGGDEILTGLSPAVTVRVR